MRDGAWQAAVPDREHAVAVDLPSPAVRAALQARLADFRARGDDRRIFLSLYATMTGAIDRAVTEGRFLDPVWTAELTDRFIVLYLDAEEAWRRGGAGCPTPWCAAFHATGQARVNVVEHALLGINAHIVHDLPLAVAETLISRGDATDGRLQGEALARRRYDYEVVNHVIAETIDDAQAVLAAESRTSAVLDRLALRFDAYVAEAMLRAARTQGWHAAVALAVARDDAERAAVRTHLERVACTYVERLDLTQLAPLRLRTTLARWRPPLRLGADVLGGPPGR